MKGLNLIGTTSESFKMGVGENSVELRVIEGKLYFKNFGEPFKELLANDAEIVLSPLQWSPNVNYGIGNLIYYSGGLFVVIKAHISGNNFLANNDSYRKIYDVNNFTKINVAAQGSVSLDLLSSQYVYLFGNAPGQFTLKLPDPTSIKIGSQYTIQNNSSKTIKVFTNNNVLVSDIDPYNTKVFSLIDFNNLFDSWSYFLITSDPIDFGLQVKTISFDVGQQYIFIGSSGVFEDNNSGKYSFFDVNDADLNGDIFWTTGAQSCRIVTFSNIVASGDSPNFFCFFNINDDLYLKNNTSVSRDIVFHRLYQQGI
jgi:hypothetical protein